jgi:hemolysin activation/secretion protein
MQTISPFLGLDYGEIKREENTRYSCGRLAGYALGIKTNAKMIDTEFTFSRGLKHIANQDFQNLFRYNITLKF